MPPGESLPAPGPSFLRDLPLTADDSRQVGMSHPQVVADGWWVTLLWCERDGFVVDFAELSPEPRPPGSPLQRLGPALAGLLSGMILVEGNRQQLRLRLGQPPEDGADAWDAPLAIVAGIRFEPARVATIRETELATTVLEAFRDALVRIAS